MLIRMPARKYHEESAVWVCPEFIEAMVPDKDKLSRAFVYMQSGVMHTVTVDEPFMAFEEIVDVIRKANQKGNNEASSAREEV